MRPGAPPVLLRRDPEAGARVPYEDPAVYAWTWRDRVEDVAFYVGLARESGGPVPEIGTGNGRVGLPVARAGVALTGVDRSEAMLADFRARLRREPPGVRRRVRLRRGDMRTFRLRRRFPLVICPFNTVLHLVSDDDVEAFLATVRAHLAPGGRFVADLATPSPADLARRRPWGSPPFRHPTAGIVRYREHYDYDRVRQLLHVTMVHEPVDGSRPAWTEPLCHRQFFPREWALWLRHAGYEAEAVHGDFAGGPLGQDNEVMVWTARRAHPRA